MNRVFHDKAWVKPISLAGVGLDYEDRSIPKKCSKKIIKCLFFMVHMVHGSFVAESGEAFKTLLDYRKARDTAKDEQQVQKNAETRTYRTQKLALLEKLIEKNN